MGEPTFFSNTLGVARLKSEQEGQAQSPWAVSPAIVPPKVVLPHRSEGRPWSRRGGVNITGPALSWRSAGVLKPPHKAGRHFDVG